jgi:hypothetical protein
MGHYLLHVIYNILSAPHMHSLPWNGQLAPGLIRPCIFGPSVAVYEARVVLW